MYADCLIEGELLKKYMTRNGTEIYETTEKGKKFLNDYGKIRKILENMRLQPKEIMVKKFQIT
jgi:predicted transcriptional regulator